MAERVALLSSLRLRLMVGAAIMAGAAIVAASLAASGVTAAAKMVERSATAQQRIDLLSALSGRIGDYAVVAAETASPDVPEAARMARLDSQATRVAEAFAQVDAALARSMAEVENEGEAEQMRRATRSLGLARMRAQFEALERNVRQPGNGGDLRAHLNTFATQFSPLLNEAINDERRDRDAASDRAAALQGRMILWALGIGLGATALLALIYLFVVRPLLRHLGEVRASAARIGAGEFDVALPAGDQSELGQVMAEMTRMAGQLKERQHAVDRDRAELNTTIAERTSRLEAANERLSRIDTERRRFFADVGHELRTPLTVILAESELGLGGAATTSPEAESLAVIHARAKRLNRRIDDLLRVARSETGQIDLNIGRFDLAQAADAAVADMRPVAKRHHVALTADLTPATVQGDRDWCRQVICGLIENALRNSPAGAIVEIGCAPSGNGAELTVLDEGKGLPDGEQDAVFSRFVRGSREAGGSGFGVGLALAKWVVDQQAGEIALASPAPRAPRGGQSGGRGVEVTITLPRDETGTGETPT